MKAQFPRPPEPPENELRRDGPDLNSIALLVLAALCAAFLFCALPGCASDTGLLATGAVGGTALTNTFGGMQADLKARQADLLHQQQEVLDQLESANDQAEKAALEAVNAALKKKIQTTADLQTRVALAEKAVATDWTDPQQTAPWISSAVLAALALLTKRKQVSVSKLLQATNDGIEKFKAQADPDTAGRLYADVKDRKDKANV